jgi:hypothetical protein
MSSKSSFRLSNLFSKSNLGLFSVVASAVVLVPAANASDLTWGGFYRVEAVKINNSELSSNKTDKSYGLQHLILNPKLVAADGLTIYSRLDVLNDSSRGINSSGQVFSTAGDVFGAGAGTPVAANGSTGPLTGTDSNSYGRTVRAGTLAVTELYASWSHEFGQLIVGRAPIHFGLGTAFNAGEGLFDHYVDTRDMVAYKIVLGNFSITPILGKMYEGGLAQEDDVDDYMIRVQYDNPDTELSLGFIYDMRVALGNDAPNGITGTPAVPSYWGNGYTRGGSFKNTLMGIYLSQKPLSWLRASIEADMTSGDTGIINPSGNSVGINAFGVAAEVAFLPSAESRWSGMIKFGMASGDDPGTSDTYEGFVFNRNYDVAMLLFNHPLGQADFMRTGLVRDATTAPSSQLDTEAISNAIYFAPTVKYRAKDNLSYSATLVHALLNKDPIGSNAGTSTDLGYELDFHVTWNPIERLTWITEAGFLLPGSAWQGGSSSFENKFAYGLITKAAIRF